MLKIVLFIFVSNILILKFVRPIDKKHVYYGR